MKILLTLFLICIIQHTWAQEEVKETTKTPGLIEKTFDVTDHLLDALSGKSWTFIPALTYSPETSLGLGAKAIKIIRSENREDNRPSTLPITLLYTLRKQVIFTSALDLWINENSDHFNARLELSDYPFKYYGIGNENSSEAEDYASRFAHVQLSYEKLFKPGLYFGPQYEFKMEDVYEIEADGDLSKTELRGSEGQLISGLGLKISFDTRKNIFQPEQGSFHQAKWISYQPFFGSDFTFNQYQFDLRKYIPVPIGKTLAVQAWYSFTTGNPPFQQLSLIGGSDLMRGFFEGRYRDRHAMVYQAEYRIPVYRKLGVVLFSSAGQVADTLPSFSFGGFKYGGGVGFRYQLTDDGLNLRLDLGYGEKFALYFGLNEAL